jgi:site-specific DNA recombinase
MRKITRRLNADQVPTPTGKPVWGVSTIGRLLRNHAYVGRVYYNRTETVPTAGPGRRPRQRPRAHDEWIPIAVPQIVADDTFQAAQQVSRDNAQWSPRRAEPGQWLLRGLVTCGTCQVGVNCHKMRGRNATFHRYYYCRNHDPLRAGGEDRRCPERNIRADALDTFVTDQVRQALLRPEVLLAGEHAVAERAPAPDDELLGAQLARLDRKAEATQAERRRLVDCYQAGLLDLVELQRRAKDLDARQQQTTQQRQALAAERDALATDNRLRQHVGAFAEQVLAALDHLDFDQHQQLLRLIVEEVRVTGWHVDIRLRIPLDDIPPPNQPPRMPHPSSEDRLRSLGEPQGRQLPGSRTAGRRWPAPSDYPDFSRREPSRIQPPLTALYPGGGARVLRARFAPGGWSGFQAGCAAKLRRSTHLRRAGVQRRSPVDQPQMPASQGQRVVDHHLRVFIEARCNVGDLTSPCELGE